jgi:hypothetical protein
LPAPFCYYFYSYLRLFGMGWSHFLPIVLHWKLFNRHERARQGWQAMGCHRFKRAKSGHNLRRRWQPVGLWSSKASTTAHCGGGSVQQGISAAYDFSTLLKHARASALIY